MNKSIVYILVAGIFFGLVNIFVKSLHDFNIFQLVFFRSVIVLILSGAMIRKKKMSFRNKHWKLLVLRGASGSIALCMYFYTIQRMPLASAVTIQYISPLFSVVLAAVLFGEKFNKIQLPFMLLAFAGVVIMKNFEPDINTTELMIGMAGAFFTGLAYTSIRMLGGKADPQLVIFYFPLIALPIVTPLMIAHWQNPTLTQWAQIIAMAVSAYVAQVFMTKGYQGERIAKTAVFRYFGLIYAVIWGNFLFDEIPSLATYLGIGLILLGVILNNRFALRQ